jgi:hypothetical protein
MPTDLLAELIADAQQIVLPRPRLAEMPHPAKPVPVDEIVIPPTTVSLVDGYADYGV